MNKLQIDGYVEKLASNKNIKSFYPVSVCKALNLSINDVIDRLTELSNIGYLNLKFEIRCCHDLTIFEIVDDYSIYLGKPVYCIECNDYVQIALENIFPIYFINKDYREYVKKNYQSTQPNLCQHHSALDVNEDIISVDAILADYLNNDENMDINHLAVESELNQFPSSQIITLLQSIDNNIKAKNEETRHKSLYEKARDFASDLDTFNNAGQVLCSWYVKYELLKPILKPLLKSLGLDI